MECCEADSLLWLGQPKEKRGVKVSPAPSSLHTMEEIWFKQPAEYAQPFVCNSPDKCVQPTAAQRSWCDLRQMA